MDNILAINHDSRPCNYFHKLTGVLSMSVFGLPEKFNCYRRRAPTGELGNAQNGMIYLPQKGLAIIFSDGGGWEHVSISRASKMPTYQDLDYAKRLFWGDDSTVMQLFVPLSDHINNHEFCLHLWRPINGEVIPRPPAIFV